MSYKNTYIKTKEKMAENTCGFEAKSGNKTLLTNRRVPSQTF